MEKDPSGDVANRPEYFTRSEAAKLAYDYRFRHDFDLYVELNKTIGCFHAFKLPHIRFQGRDQIKRYERVAKDLRSTQNSLGALSEKEQAAIGIDAALVERLHTALKFIQQAARTKTEFNEVVLSILQQDLRNLCVAGTGKDDKRTLDEFSRLVMERLKKQGRPSR